MKAWLAVALAGLVIVNAPEQVRGQSRGSVGSHTHGPAAGPGRLSSNGLHVGPSRRPSTPPRFISTIMFAPAPLASRHRPFLFRSTRFGLVLFDPAWFWAPSIGEETFGVRAFPPPMDTPPAGGLQLDVEPRRALVYVDDWYVGVVEDFSGYYHHLEIGAGSHIIEIVAPDYEPLIIHVAVSPGRTTTYRATLNRAPGSD
jgi:hypothetical protein